MYSQFLMDMRAMGLDGLDRDTELLGGALVRKAAHQELEDLTLSMRQPDQRSHMRGGCLERGAVKRRRQVALATRHRSYRQKDVVGRLAFQRISHGAGGQ